MADRAGITVPTTADRLSIRQRPGGLPIMFQSWRKLLFMHWQIDPDALRPHVPERLEIDTFDGTGWLGITPFVVRNVRPPFLPPLPWLSDFTELNVRTYVHFRGVPGVWFFSLDADSLLAVLGARGTFRLPYHHARMTFTEEKDRIAFTSRRLGRDGASFEGVWRKGRMTGEADPASLEFFLVERYCLYATHRGRLYRARISHPPWRLQEAELTSLASTMLESQGVPRGAGSPLLHYSEIQDTFIWPLTKI